MTIFLKHLVDFLIQPLNILLLLLLLSGVSYFKGWYKLLKGTAVSFIVIFLTTGSSPIPNLLATHLENQYSPLIEIDSNAFQLPVHILVLGSGHVADPDLPATGQLTTTAMGRLSEGIRLHEQLPNSVLIVSGYASGSTIAQAEVLAEAAVLLGVDEHAVRKQTKPSTTEEEANIYKETFRSDHPLIIATSALHMPRAIRIFENRGLQPIAAPTYYLVKDDPQAAFSWRLLSHENFYKVQAALHEYIGLLYERWFTKTRQG